MYNAEQKTKFIKEFTDSVTMRNTALRVFNALEKYEEEFGKDVVTMNIDELQQVFDKVSGIRDRSKQTPRYVLREYSAWALMNRVPGATAAAVELHFSSVERLRRSLLRNPKQLQVYLDQICLPESEQTVDNNYRAFYWLGYSGMEDTDAICVRKSEVDFSRMVIAHNGVEYPIYREAIPALKNCATLDQYKYIHPNYQAAAECFRDRAPGDELLRGIRGVGSLGGMRAELCRRGQLAVEQGKTELNLSYNRIWMSGIFYRMYEDELAGFPVSFDDITRKKVGDKPYKLSKTRKTPQYKFKELSRDYKTDYERWKQSLILP